ncbi:LOW QUALITY PROTEIN: high-affinity choline transporter 1-like [Xyrichtys novacula]|uniref:LOW QUALITY PROTEIN: high-affinity choline transporter 1-like n=1 Tax=Xyrichtys novacula TaxID=13765 RepID=A0AAV1HS07_XYRNO|nr:LOW QUALITY PROTEIN: high-affinity choline transporter 1-like [Xyrichtys novacula]
MVVFYLLVLGIGLWASSKSRKMAKNSQSRQVEISFLADRSVGLVVGVFTMTATWVGGAFIMGVAETVYNPTKGLLWALIPLQMSVSFIIGGLFFAGPMRDQNYITMMDPFQRKYGEKMTGFLSIIPFISELMWVPAALISLGVTVRIFSDLPLSLCIWISAAVAIIYTVLGGLYSVAFTDVVQLTLVFSSLWLCTPFVLANDVYADISQTAFNHTNRAPWIGQLEYRDMWTWIDNFLAMSAGNLAFQDFHQRILSSSSTSTAKIICFVAAGVVLILAIPPVLVGAVAASTDWNLTSYGLPSPYDRGESAMVFPIILLHLTPTAVFVIGMGAIAGAAMSSTDSFLLAASSIFTTNIYKLIRPQASDRELQWVIRSSIVLVGIVGTSFTYLDSSILALWILSSDLTYTIMFPQLICILFIRVSNPYGAVIGYIIAFVLRALCGEPVLNLPAILHFPGCTLEDGVYIQRSPFKTICMLVSLVSIVGFSYLASILFEKEILPERWDVFKVKSQGAPAEGARECDKEKAKNENEPMLELHCQVHSF